MHLAGFSLIPRRRYSPRLPPAISKIPPSHHSWPDPARNELLNLAVPSTRISNDKSACVDVKGWCGGTQNRLLATGRDANPRFATYVETTTVQSHLLHQSNRSRNARQIVNSWLMAGRPVVEIEVQATAQGPQARLQPRPRGQSFVASPGNLPREREPERRAAVPSLRLVRRS
jgi:hypothetical protein